MISPERNRVFGTATAFAAAIAGMVMMWTGFFTAIGVVVAAASVVALAVLIYKMAQPVQVHASSRESSRTLHRFAIVCLLWPLLVVVLLYGEWLLATWSLGHVPRPSADDPKNIAGSNWMHLFTLIAIVGAVPAALLALVLSVIEIWIKRPGMVRVLDLIAALLVSWAVLVLLVKWDPGRVLYWWMD